MSVSRPAPCSRDMYPGLPTTAPVSVRPQPPSVGRARPKSAILGWCLVSGGGAAGGEAPGRPGASPPAAPPPLTTHQPKIADFGLARPTEGGCGLTETGAVVGKPGYMSREQGAGRETDIGVAPALYLR